MDKQEVKNSVLKYFRDQIALMAEPGRNHQIQMGNLYHLFDEYFRQGPPQSEMNGIFSTIRETVNDLVLAGIIYPGQIGDQNSGYPWLTVSEYGKEALAQDDWLPYDPEGYLKALRNNVPEIDEVSFRYAAESISAFHRRQLLAATLTLGVASENLMLTLIGAYSNWIKEPVRKTDFEKATRDKGIYSQYKEFKAEFSKDVKLLPKELQNDWESYLEGIFNFIRINRNDAGHPTGTESNAKIIYANLQIFSDYSRYIFDLIKYFSP